MTTQARLRATIETANNASFANAFVNQFEFSPLATYVFSLEEIAVPAIAPGAYYSKLLALSSFSSISAIAVENLGAYPVMLQWFGITGARANPGAGGFAITASTITDTTAAGIFDMAHGAFNRMDLRLINAEDAANNGLWKTDISSLDILTSVSGTPWTLNAADTAVTLQYEAVRRMIAAANGGFVIATDAIDTLEDVYLHGIGGASTVNLIIFGA
jgi:hypothetical protein